MQHLRQLVVFAALSGGLYSIHRMPTIPGIRLTPQSLAHSLALEGNRRRGKRHAYPKKRNMLAVSKRVRRKHRRTA